MKCPLKAYF